LVHWSTEVLRAVCDRVVVAVPAGYERAEEGPDRVVGGASRSESVRNALAAAPEAEIAVVHDAARPLVTAELVERCVAAIHAPGVAGAVAAAPVTDTIKEADGAGRVLRTLDRGALWSIQTPQVFWAEPLRAALDADPATLAAATDDAGLIEAAGGTVAIVEAPAENLKVTTALDLRLAELSLSRRAARADA
jgi:2-C-methyl-D-erythritol 4-phosphate cytidylyltransferase